MATLQKQLLCTLKRPYKRSFLIQMALLQTNVSLWWESRFFFYFHIWTTEVIPYNALNLEFADFETPCIKNMTLKFQKDTFKGGKKCNKSTSLFLRCTP
jgi:hypothetical protein